MPVIEGFSERTARGAGGAIEGFTPRITGELRPPSGSRSPLGFANDTVVTGLNSALGIGKAISDFVSVDNPVSRGLQYLIDEGEQTYTPQTRAAREELFRSIDEGGWDAARGVGEFVLTSPVQAAAMAAGNFGPFGVGIKGARGLAALGGAGTAGVRAAGIGTASAMGGAAAGGDAAGDAYEQVMRSPNVDPAVREELARQAAREASVVPAVIGAATPFLPGSAESQLARGLGITRASIPRAAASEFGQEFVEEGATKLSANLAAQQYDPAIDASRGVLGSALLGGVLGAGTGATISYINNRGVQADLLRRDAAIEAQLREREAQLAPILGMIRPDSGVGAQDLINQQLGISPALSDKELARQRKQREADILAAFNEPSGVRVPGTDGQERELSAIEASLMQQGLPTAPTSETPAPVAPSKVFSPEEQELVTMGVVPSGKALELLSEIKASGLPMDSLEPVITAMSERKNAQAKKLLAQAIIEARKPPTPAAAVAPQAPIVVAPVQPPVGATAASVAEAPGVTSLPVPEVAPDVQAPQAVQGEAPAEAAVAAPAAQDAAPAAATEPVAPTEPVIQRKVRRVVDPAALQQEQAFVASEPTEEQAAPADPNVAAWEDSKPDDAPALTALTPALQQVWAQAVAAKGEGRRVNLFKIAEDIVAEQGDAVSDDDTLATLNQIFGERDAAMLYDRYVDNLTEEAIANKYGLSRQAVAKVTGEGSLGQKTRATKIRNAQQKFGWSDEYVQQLAARLSPAQTETEAAPTSGRTGVDLEATESAFGADTAPEMGGRDPSLREAGFSTSASLGGSVSNWRDSGELAGRENITQADQAKLDALYARRAAAEEAGNDSEVESADAEISQVETKYLSPSEVAAKFAQQSVDLREKALKRRQQIEQARAAGKDTVSVNNKLVPVAELEAQEEQLQQKAQEALDRAEGVLQRGAVRKAKGAAPKADKSKVRRVKKDEAKAPTAPAVEQTAVLTLAEQAARAWDQATNTIPGAPKWADLTPAQQREFVGYGEGNWTRQDVVTMLQRAAPSNSKFGKDARVVKGGYTAAELTDEIKAFIRADVLGRKLVIVDTIGDLLKSSDSTRVQVGGEMALNNAYGVASDGRAYLVADRIKKGSGRAKFMHEVGAHLGLENLLPRAVYDKLTQQIVDWAKADNGSLESEIALDATERVMNAGTKKEDRRSEMLAYFIEVAMERGIDPTAETMKGSKGLREWFRTLWAAFKLAARRLGMKPESMTAQDVVNLAFGAARLEITGTWHGTAAAFRQFNHKFMGSGEGAQAFGWGTYLAQKFGIAKGYWSADVKRKTTPEEFRVKYDGVEAGYIQDSSLNGAVVGVMNQLRSGRKTPQQAIDAVVADLEKRVASVQRSVDSARRHRLPGLPDLLESLEFNKEDLAVAKGLDPAKFEVVNQKYSAPEGALMRVDTAVPDNELLDWDKPLSAQPAVLDKIERVLPNELREAVEGESNSELAGMSGQDFYRALEWLEKRDGLISEQFDDVEDYNKRLAGEAPKRIVSALLDEQYGIPGIKFLDAPSRKGGGEVRFGSKKFDADQLRSERLAAKAAGDQDRLTEVMLLADILRNGLDAVRQEVQQKFDAVAKIYYDSARSAADRYNVQRDDAKLRVDAEEQAKSTYEGQKLEWVERNAERVEVVKPDATRNLVIFNDKNIFRVGAQTGADRQRMRFGKDLREQLPEPLKKPVGTITTVLNDTKNLGLNLLTFTEDVMNRAIDLGVKSAGRLRTIYQERAALTGKLEREVERVADLYNRVPERERGTGPQSVNQFLYDATREGKWGFKPSWRRGPSAAVTLDPDMVRRYGALSRESKALVEAIFRHGDEVLSLKKQTVIDATNSEYDVLIAAANKAGDSKKAARLTADKADQLKRFNSLFELQEFRPYAPLRRFGNYVVIARSQKYLDADEKAQRQLEKSEDHYHVSFAESAAAARELVEQLNKQGAFAEVVFREKEAVQQTMFGGTLTAFNKLRSELDSELADAAPGEKAAIRAARKVVGELYLSTLAENSARKSEMRRRGVAGEIDVLRSFTTQGRADARFIAGAKYNGQTLEAFNAMRREVKTGGAEDQNTKSGVFNELMKRHTQSLDYDPTPIASKLARLSTIWYLATSPAYYLQNLTQPFMLSMPVMAGRHNYLKVGNALIKAYTDLAPMFRSAKLGEQFNYGAAPADVRAAISTLVDRGRIDIGMDTDLGNFQLEGQGPIRDRWNKIDRAIRNGAQKLEAVNRLSTAIAAYRMELAKTGDAAKALEYADSIISQTHGDYTALNAPRAFNTATGKVALQFRKFQLIQLTLLTKLVNNSLPNKQDAAVARKALAFTLGHTAVMAGAIGLPGFAAIAWALGMMDGDDEPFNAEKELREFIGNDQLATLLTRGAPAALGVDLSQKLGMGNTLSLLPFNNLDLSSRSGLESAAFALFGGPAGGLTLRAADGITLIRDGQYYRGLEQLVPTGLTNAMRAGREASEGVTRRNGDVLIAPEEISGMETFWRAIGLQPTQMAERQFFDKVVRDTDQTFKKRADRIRNAYLRAGDDYDARAEARDRWMELQDAREAAGYRRQPLSSLIRAEQRQDERERNTVGGVQFNRDNRSFVQELIAAEED